MLLVKKGGGMVGGISLCSSAKFDHLVLGDFERNKQAAKAKNCAKQNVLILSRGDT